MGAVQKRITVVLVTIIGCSSTPPVQPIRIPNGQAGIGFDDLRYSMSLQRVLVPAGRTGTIAMVAQDGRIDSIGGFSASPDFDGGHDFGVTSVDEGNVVLFATDRTKQALYAVDPAAKVIIGSYDLSGGPDYVRYVTSTEEVWVTEPGEEQIEIISASKATPLALMRLTTIPIANGPESLVIDATRGRAYTHRWQASTVAIDVRTHAIVGEWPNACAASRGIEVDPSTGFVLIACNEGTAVVLDPSQNGRILSRLDKGSGYDVIGFNPNLRHLYLAGGACSCLTILGLSKAGQLSWLGRFDAPADTHCVTADEHGNAWICAPRAGSVVRVHDPFPATE